MTSKRLWKSQIPTTFTIQPGYYDNSSADDRKGYDRYEALYEALRRKKGVVSDAKDAMNVLSIVGRRSWNNDDKNCCTVHSVIYNLTDRTVLWVPNENYDDESAYY